jgi:hypothetical protein
MRTQLRSAQQQVINRLTALGQSLGVIGPSSSSSDSEWSEDSSHPQQDLSRSATGLQPQAAVLSGGPDRSQGPAEPATQVMNCLWHHNDFWMPCSCVPSLHRTQ